LEVESQQQISKEKENSENLRVQIEEHETLKKNLEEELEEIKKIKQRNC